MLLKCGLSLKGQANFAADDILNANFTADDIFYFYFYFSEIIRLEFFKANKIWHFMQIICWNVKSYFSQKKKNQNVSCTWHVKS